MLKYDKKFSFDKFEGQLVALVRMAVLAEKPENLACYAAGTRDAQFADILEMTYTNGLCLNKLWLEGDQMHMSIRTWWINYYENDGKIKKRRLHRHSLCEKYFQTGRAGILHHICLLP